MKRPEARGSKFYRWGRVVHRRRWWVMAGWALLLVALLPQVSQFQGRLSNGGFTVPGSDSSAVTHLINQKFPHQSNQSDLLVLTSSSMKATDPSFKATTRRVIAALSRASGVASVTDPYQDPDTSISSQGDTAVAQVNLSDDQDQALAHTPRLETAVARASRGSGVTALLTGSAPYYRSLQDTTTQDLTRAETVAIPITLLILLLAFGTAVAAGIPLITAGIALGAAFGFISILATLTGVSIFTENMASMIGLGVGIDYALFLVSRFRERLRIAPTAEVALGETMATTGKTVFVSALTVTVALSGVLLVDVPAYRSMGVGAMIAVVLAGASALTLLPALLAALGPRIDKLALPRVRVRGEGLWHRWATWVMRHPWGPLVGGVAILVLLALPSISLQMGSSGVSILPADAKPRIAAQDMAASFGQGRADPMLILVTTPGPITGKGFSAVYRLSHEVAAQPEVAGITSIATLRPDLGPQRARALVTAPGTRSLVAPLISDDGKTTLLSVATMHDPQSIAAGNLVKQLRKQLASAAPPGTTVRIGGGSALNVDINDELHRDLPLVIGFVLLLSYMILLLYVRSVLLPLKAILLNLGSVLASYGLVVFIFQEGHLAGLLGFSPQGFIESFLPVFLFTVLFGLSMDYEVFILSRIREEYQRTGDNTHAVALGLERSASIVTSAAAVMVTVFAGFATASLVPIKALGFGLASAVFIDATLIRVVLVPALMRLMGRWNWWLPRSLAGPLARFSLAEAELEPGRPTGAARLPVAARD